jgi:hypothetical protein
LPLLSPSALQNPYQSPKLELNSPMVDQLRRCVGEDPNLVLTTLPSIALVIFVIFLEDGRYLEISFQVNN